MRYRLRTLLILLGVGPPVLAAAWLLARMPPRGDALSSPLIFGALLLVFVTLAVERP